MRSQKKKKKKKKMLNRVRNITEWLFTFNCKYPENVKLDIYSQLSLAKETLS